MDEESCGICRFWDDADLFASGGIRVGRCRRRSPILVHRHGKDHASFPLMSADKWCGDFRKGEAE